MSERSSANDLIPVLRAAKIAVDLGDDIDVMIAKGYRVEEMAAELTAFDGAVKALGEAVAVACADDAVRRMVEQDGTEAE